MPLVRLLLGALLVSAAVAEKPNLVLIVADDFGHNDIGYHGGDVPTPVMDGLANKGVKLDSFYTQPICAATRSSIMSGRYVIRTGFQHFNAPVGGGGVGALPLKEKILPQYLKAAGYSTYHVGKWHLGLIKEAYLPQNRGFDTTFGYYSGAIDYYTHTAQGHLDLHRAVGPGSTQTCGTIYDGTYDLGVLITEANRVLDRHSPRLPNATDPEAPEAPLDPLFLYLALHSVHEPNEVDRAWTRPYVDKPNPLSCPRQTMCGMIAAMDDGLGQFVDHWRSAKGEAFWNNTILLFHSDNGGPVYPGAANKNLPLRGGKLTLFDGGMRVNAFAYSAGWLPNANGRVEAGLMHITDIIPTFVGLAGGSLTGSNGKLDGYDMWPTISEGAPSKRTEILHLVDPLGNDASVQVKGCVASGDAPGKCTNSSAIRVGDFKLIVGMWAACSKNNGSMDPRMCGWWNPDTPSMAQTTTHANLDPLDGPFSGESYGLPEVAGASLGDAVALFNIATDPNELHDLSESHPALVTQLKARLDEHYTEMVAGGTTGLMPQWNPFHTCDTPDKSCAKQDAELNAAANKKGCLDVFIPTTPRAGLGE